MINIFMTGDRFEPMILGLKGWHRFFPIATIPLPQLFTKSTSLKKFIFVSLQTLADLLDKLVYVSYIDLK
jgi:hypothetical protein